MSEKNISGATYVKAEAGYFEKRTLRRSAGFWGIWGLGVAAVISGEFSGWNLGVADAGFGGMTIATIIVIVMYFTMLFSIGEMSAALPHTGGAYSFARAALGPWGGFITGLAESIEYVVTTAVVVFFAAQYANGALEAFFNGFSISPYLMWAILYAAFVIVNALGAAVGFRLAIIVSVLAIAILAVFVIVAFATGSFSVDKLFDVKATAGNSAFLPHGFLPVLAVIPFAMWFFLGIEELPLAAEESHNPQRDIPRAGIFALVTLLICAVVIFVVNTGVNGATAIQKSGQPLLDGFALMVPKSLAGILAVFALIGLLASLQGIMFAYGRNLYSLSRAGYYPKFLSVTGKRQTPVIALVLGAVIGYVLLVVVQFTTDIGSSAATVAGAIVLNIAIWGAVVAYIMQMISFIVLRRRYPNAKRPYLSPTGIPGAVIAGVIALVIFVAFLFSPGYQIAIAAIAVVYIVGLLIFGFVSRHRLVLSPEEEFALSHGLHGNPQVEGYDEMEDEVFGSASS
ncbi:amino acid permease [Galbitalea soli]|uniref:Amino acid permease n=1 Tax=Galbitalea soli TaxID=1268042 RepID=A0A7C9TNQ0_9MICO|nr:amino acid permease [Galbitalea soli]NEM89740.1 amino acid permease [Galbitalea soli]NYJ30440.1 ethanolamine permease [Galbitalea soli]